MLPKFTGKFCEDNVPNVMSESAAFGLVSYRRFDGKIEHNNRGNRRFTISELSLDFPQVSRSVIYDILSEKLGYKKLCARWVPKMLTDGQKQKRLAVTTISLGSF